MADVQRVVEQIRHDPYNLTLYIDLANQYLDLDYPDLAAGAAYRALLLSDAVADEGDEFHDQALASLQEQHGACRGDDRLTADIDALSVRDDPIDSSHHLSLVEHHVPIIYQILSRSLLSCGCLQSAFLYSSQARRRYPNNVELQKTHHLVCATAAKHAGVDEQALFARKHDGPVELPDRGFVRREIYPWNTFEPDRLRELSTLNELMDEVAPKLEVLVVELPDLTTQSDSGHASTVKQLGVFAKEDIAAGEVVLTENSILTANNKLQDTLCDACSTDLPELGNSEAANTVSCPDCEVVFCSQQCHDRAMDLYHPALCERDVESIAKDVSPTAASDALYSLLLLRTLAMAETQQCHPLELNEVKYIWGDFHNTHPQNAYDSADCPKSLPFSFEHNIRLPFHMLEKMDIDIFANPQYDVWVFNTLYAKFRGTASARLSGRGGRAARGPEVGAVHPMWCLANHSCDPNVSWEWGGAIEFRARQQRVAWRNPHGESLRPAAEAGIKKGEEIFNHYCDIDLPVKERREWAEGALGGACRCPRCIFEAGENA